MLERVSGTVRSEPASRASGKVVIVAGERAVAAVGGRFVPTDVTAEPDRWRLSSRFC